MDGGKKRNIFVELRPFRVRKFIIFSMACMNVLGMGLKQQPCIYWMNYVFVFSFIIMACTGWWRGL